MIPLPIRTALFTAIFSTWLTGATLADDNLKIAIGQRGGWEQSVSELGQNKGIFKKHGLTLELLYTQGSAETLTTSKRLVMSRSAGTSLPRATMRIFPSSTKFRLNGAAEKPMSSCLVSTCVKVAV